MRLLSVLSKQALAYAVFFFASFVSASSPEPSKEALEHFGERLGAFLQPGSAQDYGTLFDQAYELLDALAWEMKTIKGEQNETILDYERDLFRAQDEKLRAMISPKEVLDMYGAVCPSQVAPSQDFFLARKTCPLCAIVAEAAWEQHMTLLKTLINRHIGRLIWPELDNVDFMDAVSFSFLQRFKDLSIDQKADFLLHHKNVPDAHAWLGEEPPQTRAELKKVRRDFNNARRRLRTYFGQKKSRLLQTPAYEPFLKPWKMLQICDQVVDMVGDFYVAVELHIAHARAPSSLTLAWDGQSTWLHKTGCPCLGMGPHNDIPLEPSSATALLHSQASLLQEMMAGVMEDAFSLVRMGLKKTPLSQALEEDPHGASPDDPMFDALEF